MPQDNQVTVGKAPKKRLTDIDVNEVSLVDRPANEEEFAVVKSVKGEEGTMSATNTETNPEAVAPPTAPAAVPVPPATEPAKPVEKADEPKPVDPVETASTVSEALSKLTESVSKQYPEDPSKLIEALKKIAEIAAMAVAELEKAKGGKGAGAYPNPKGYEYGKPMKKGVRIQLDSETGEVGIDEVEAVEKGARFTPARAAAIKSAIMSLINIAKEVDESMLPEIAKACGVSGPEKDKMKKSEDDAATIAKLTGEVESLTKRLADAEKTRVPGNAAPTPEGNATPVKKDAGSIWEGVL